WRFFPTRDREWVIWRWRDYYYHTSTKGDFNIGWQRNYKVTEVPVFSRAEQFRAKFHDQKKVEKTLQFWEKTTDEFERFAHIEPPEVKLVLVNKQVQVKDDDLKLELHAAPSGPQKNQRLARVILWNNDHQLKVWEEAKDPANFAEGKPFQVSFTVPLKQLPSVLRSGANQLLLQCYNKGDVRGDSTPLRVEYVRPKLLANLYGLLIGVGDYSKSSPQQDTLRSPEDAASLKKSLDKQLAVRQLYQKVDIKLLRDKEVTPDSLRAALRSLAAQVKPDD